MAGEIDKPENQRDEADHRADYKEWAAGKGSGEDDDNHGRTVNAQGAHHECQQGICPVDADAFHPLDIDIGGGCTAEWRGEIDADALQMEIELVGGRNLMSQSLQRELIGVGDRQDAENLDDDDGREPGAVGGFEPIENVV